MSNPGIKTRNNVSVSLGDLNLQSVGQDKLPAQMTTTRKGSSTSFAPISLPLIDPGSSPVQRLPAQPLIITALVPLQLPPVPGYTTDRLTLNENTFTTNRGYIPVTKAGISAYRPEIVAVVDFQPLIDNTGVAFTNVGTLFDLNYQARMLRNNTLDGIFTSIATSTNRQLSTDLTTLATSYTTSINSLGSILTGFTANILEVKNLEKSFEIKDIPDNAYDTSRLLTLRTFFTRRMQFSGASYDIFSETKILEQALFDLRSALDNYSVSLFDSVDPDRSGDVSPVNLDKTYTFSFTVDGIRSNSNPRDATTEREFSNVVNSLPVNPDDRIRLLVHLLSKELRISKGLSKASVRRKLTETFQAQLDGNPFDNIIGGVGNNIFEAPLGINSLASLLFLKLDNNNFVLPFENKYVDDSNKTFIPGNKYFADTILNQDSAGNYNLVPLTTYSNTFSTVVGNTKTLFADLMGFGGGSNSLLPGTVMALFGNALKTTLQTTTNARTASSEALVSIALFKLASTDRPLRRSLFKFLCYAGVATGPSRDTQGIFARGFKDAGQSNDVFPYDQLDIQATAIEQRVGLLTRSARTTTNTSSNNTTTTDPKNPLIVLQEGAIKTALMTCITTSGGTSNLFKEFIHLCNTLDQAATIEGNELSYTLLDSTGRTRYNYISSSFLLLMMFETFIALTNKYASGEFIQSTRNSIRFSVDFNAGIVNMIGVVKRPPRESEDAPVLGIISASPPTPPKANKATFALTPAYAANMNKVEDEDLFVENILHIFDVINTKLVQSTRHATSFFGSSIVASKSRQLNENQVRISTCTFDRYNRDPGLFGNSDTVSVDERNAVVSLLKEQPFIGPEVTTKIKLLSVGIPAGFIDFLSGRLKREAINQNSFKNQNQDLIKVNVYCRMAEFDDISFKPQTFLFDMALFYNQPANIQEVQSFSRVILNPQTTLKDYTTGLKTVQTRAGILSGVKYRTLSTAEKQSLFYNHVVSGLFDTYVSLTTGMKLTEEVFTVDDFVGDFTTDIESIVRRYFSEVKRVPLPSEGLQAILVNPSVAEDIKDELKLLMFGNVAFKPSAIRHKVLNQKLFDRVFTIPVNLDNFIVDFQTTKQTATGRLALESSRFKNRARIDKESGEQFIPRESFVFDDLFITVETVD
jgi:hypothetical protein